MSETDIREQFASLTDKQREVLDLLIAHKTSKEIARDLGISPHTVDQRIHFAKGKLGVDTRGEVAQAYRRLLDAMARTHGEPSGSLAYEETRIVAEARPADTDRANDAALLPVPAPSQERAGVQDHHVAPDMFEGRNGTMMRLGAIAVLAVLLIFIALGSVMMFDQMSRTMAAR